MVNTAAKASKADILAFVNHGQFNLLTDKVCLIFHSTQLPLHAVTAAAFCSAILRLDNLSDANEFLFEAMRQTVPIPRYTLIMDGLIIEGPGANSFGLSTVKKYARDIGKSFGAREVIIQVGTRDSRGANPGRKPVPIRVRVN